MRLSSRAQKLFLILKEQEDRKLDHPSLRALARKWDFCLSRAKKELIHVGLGVEERNGAFRLTDKKA